VADVHVMLKKIECERRVWQTKCSQGKSERHLYQGRTQGGVGVKTPLERDILQNLHSLRKGN